MALFSKTPTVKPENIEQWVQDTYLQGVNSLSSKREDSRKWYDLVAGDMIDEATRRTLLGRGLPALKLNIVLPKILRILGAERQSRAGIKAVPLSRGKNDIAKAFTQIFEMIRVNSKGFREMRRAFEDAIIGDLGGWLEIVWTNDNDPLGQPIYRRVNPFHVIWDVKGQRYDLSDTRWILKSWFATRNDIMRDFPEKAHEIKVQLEDFQNQSASSFVTDSWERIRGAKESIDSEFYDRKENLFRVIEAQKREETREKRVYDPDNHHVQRVDSKEELEAILNSNERLMEIDWKQDRIRVITTVAGNRLKLQDVDADVQNGKFSLIPLWAYTFGDSSYGIVKNLEGPQELFWKEMSSELHVANMTANPIWMVPKNSISKKQFKDLQQFGARTGLVIETDPDQAGGQIPKRDWINAPVLAHGKLAENAKIIAEEVVGVGQNAVGRADSSGESGKLVQTRISETMAMIEVLFDNSMHTTELIHEYLISLIKTKMPGMRILDYIDDQNDSQRLIINQKTVHGILNDTNEGEYGITILKGEAQTYRQEKFVKLIALAQVIGPTPELVKLLVGTFDELDETDKSQLVKDFQAQQLTPEMIQLEQQIGEDANATRESNFADTQQVDQQLDALEKLADAEVARNDPKRVAA